MAQSWLWDSQIAVKKKKEEEKSGVRVNIIEFNQENVFTLEENKNLSKTSKILEKVIDNDTGC